jgi:transcriptional regulator ATRX
MSEVVLDFNAETKEVLVEVDKRLVKKMKPHQAKGVKFMFEAVFESSKVRVSFNVFVSAV